MTVSATIRPPALGDAPAIANLIAACPPLDTNSTYAYFLVAAHFPATSAVCIADDKCVGVCTGYLKPADPETLFIWQVAVHHAVRGNGIAGQLLDHVLDRPALSHVKWIETTVGPTNDASRALFKRLADKRGVELAESEFLTGDMFPDDHEAEDLLRLGPLNPENPQEDATKQGKSS